MALDDYYFKTNNIDIGVIFAIITVHYDRIEMSRNIFIYILLTLITINVSLAQTTLFNDVRTALKSGSSKELARYLHSSVELNLDGEKAMYSNTHAEIYLKEFFKKNPPTEFDYVHQGSSKEGLKYAIGSYQCPSGTYRVLIRVKKFNENFEIYILDFLKE